MLRRANFEVGVITVEPLTIYKKRVKTEIDLEDRVIRARVRSIPHGLLPGDRFLVRNLVRRLAKVYESEFGIPDVIHAHSVFPGVLVAKTLAKRWNIPFGITEHRPVSLELDQRTPRYSVIKKAVHNTSFQLAVSDEFSQKLSSFYGGPSFETSYLPTPDYFFQADRSARNARPFTFIHVSHLSHNKRVLETIRAFDRLHTNNPDTALKIVGGTGELLEEAKDFAGSLPSASSITFTGAIYRDKIAEIMADADCFVLVSAIESAGAVTGEAQALGLPSIVSETWGGKTYVSPETGILVPIDDEFALVQAMKQMIVEVKRGHFAPENIREVARERSSELSFTNSLGAQYRRAISL